MCTVNIKVDDAMMRRINPRLTNHESISQWIQLQVNTMIEELVKEHRKSPNAHTIKDMHAILMERIYKAESGQEEIIPNQVTFESIRTKYGF